MKTAENREIKEMPKTWATTKKEFERIYNFYKYQVQNKASLIEDVKERKEKELEDYALLFGLIKELFTFITEYEEEVSVHILDLMEELKINNINLGEYGKKLFWDDEARWLFWTEMEKRDWVDFDKDCNSKFLNKRKAERMFD